MEVEARRKAAVPPNKKRRTDCDEDDLEIHDLQRHGRAHKIHFFWIRENRLR